MTDADYARLRTKFAALDVTGQLVLLFYLTQVPNLLAYGEVFIQVRDHRVTKVDVKYESRIAPDYDPLEQLKATPSD